jgi:predicted AAA+ superfamily ATPase
MEQFIEDYGNHEALINILCIRIEKYEDSAEEFKGINERLSKLILVSQRYPF